AAAATAHALTRAHPRAPRDSGRVASYERVLLADQRHVPVTPSAVERKDRRLGPVIGAGELVDLREQPGRRVAQLLDHVRDRLEAELDASPAGRAGSGELSVEPRRDGVERPVDATRLRSGRVGRTNAVRKGARDEIGDERDA